MNVDISLLCITHTFTYNNVLGAYTINFYKEKMNIKGIGMNETIPYSNFKCIKFSNKYLKISWDKDKTIKIPVTTLEQEKIGEIFTSEDVDDFSIEPLATILVTLGENNFFLNIYNSSYENLRDSLLKKIGNICYPAFNQSGLQIDSFSNIEIVARVSNYKVPIISDDDIQASIEYCEVKINIDGKGGEEGRRVGV